MKKIFAILFLVVLFMTPSVTMAREDNLAKILEQCLLREENSPDSIEYNLQLLEKERESTSGVRRAVYSAILAKLYATRAYSDVTGEWHKRSVQLFREALADPELLYNTNTKDWVPVVKRGRNEKIYGRNMLYVVWRAANEHFADSVMTEQELLDFYMAHGNKKPATVKAEQERLRLENDSIEKLTPRMVVSMAEVYYPGDSLCIGLDTFNVKQVEWKVLDTRGKLVGKNMLLAPTVPGRYTLELKCKTDVRLEKKLEKIKVDFVVSTLHYFIMDMPGKQTRVTVVDARTGKPCPEATVVKDLKNNKVVQVVLGADSCLPTTRYYERYNYNAPSKKEQPRVAIYTDRAIYRPGQMVQLSAILYSVKHWDAKVREPRECKVQLLDGRSNKVLVDTIVCSDAFGTLSATLQIPEDIALGYHLLKVDGTYHDIRVEEYKRPHFYVEMDEMLKEVSISPLEETEGETPKDSLITLSGLVMNYDGTPVRGARVTATSRRVHCWWRRQTAEDVRNLDTIYTDMEGRFTLKVPVSRSMLYRYAPTQKVEVSVLSAQGETQTDISIVRLFADPPMESAVTKAMGWLECPVDTFDAATPAQLEFRMKEGEQRYIFLTAFAGENVAIDTVMFLTDTLTCMEIPYKEEYADGLLLNVTYCRNGKMDGKQLTLRKRLPDTKLYMHWDTFRDYTQPGTTEQWTLRVLDGNGLPANANVMLGMYDASLDAFAKNEWSFSLPMNHCIPYSQVTGYNWYKKNWKSRWMEFQVWENRIPYYEFSRFDGRYLNKRRKEFAGGWTAGSVRAFDANKLYSKKTSADILGEVPIAGEELLDASTEQAFADVEIRTDFSETAMFMPQLRTDAEGRVAITFTIPQSLTTWRLNGLAHTQDMRIGTLSEKVVARKALTCKLHLPRFVREKDNLSFSVQIANTGEVLQQGKVQVQVMDAHTDKVLMKKTLRFKADKDRDTLLVLSYQVPEGIEGLKFKAVALAQKDSDGEQREIPVLTSVVELTESRALTLEPGEKHTVDLRTLFPDGAQNKRVIVEKVSNPVQVAVDALPQVAQPSHDDVLSYASAYYAAYKLGMPDTTFFINKVYTMQKEDGSMPWYDGLAGNAYLTREVGYLLARLNSANLNARKVMVGIKRYLKAYLEESIDNRKEYNKDWTAQLSDLRTLYVLVKDGNTDKESLQLVKKVLKRLPDNIKDMDSEYIAIAMIVKHALKEAVLKDGVAVLKSRLTHKDGTYLAYRGGAWPSIDRRLHIHTQVMEAWQTVCPQDTETLAGMQEWLLNQKRTQGWKTPIDCIDAVYALTGGEFDADADAGVQRDTIDLSKIKSVTLANDGNKVMWAAVYGEYTMPVEKVEASGMDITLQRTFSTEPTKVGNRIKEKILIDAKRDYEYLVLSVPRAGCAEPVNMLSGCGWQKGVSYYMQVRDNRTDYFIPSLPHGKYIIETEMTLERQGSYATGVPTIKCCYAEEFRAHTQSEIIEVKE
ncbi:MAG: hypothetical protein IKU79_06450 [Bacteroidaceae bacterium]|nr:hypothetical protein [Bacteroidaceae bacterium]